LGIPSEACFFRSPDAPLSRIFRREAALDETGGIETKVIP
jgi:hypothetical protein